MASTSSIEALLESRLASTSGCLKELEYLRLSDTSCTTDDSSKKSDLTATTRASEADHSTSSTSYFSAVEEHIEHSKAHWSTLVDHLSDTDDEEEDFEVSNEREFEALQRHPSWGSFFANFTGSDCISTGFNSDDGELAMGKKFAEGGQAELYEAQIKWNNPVFAEIDRRQGYEWVLKVFKKGTLLKHVKFQLPQGVLQYHVEKVENFKSPTPKRLPRYLSGLQCGILLKDGRFAFLMRKEHYDLRTLIERSMKLKGAKDLAPFSKEAAEVIMYFVALGVESLHNRDIVHRDLKASNVLVSQFPGALLGWTCFVADYECSIGVIGTNFFRAPEILQACKEQKVNERPEVFSRAADVYSYGMTCYEILTGKLPFEDHPLKHRCSSLIDLVINQHLRPKVPIYVDDWARELLDGCWQFDPIARPRIGKILNVLLANSPLVRRLEVKLKEEFGDSFSNFTRMELQNHEDVTC